MRPGLVFVFASVQEEEALSHVVPGESGFESGSFRLGACNDLKASDGNRAEYRANTYSCACQLGRGPMVGYIDADRIMLGVGTQASL